MSLTRTGIVSAHGWESFPLSAFQKVSNIGGREAASICAAVAGQQTEPMSDTMCVIQVVEFCLVVNSHGLQSL